MDQTGENESEIEPDFDGKELAALALERALNQLKGCKPDGATETGRRLIFVIHELEKVIAYFDCYVLRYNDEQG